MQHKSALDKSILRQVFSTERSTRSTHASLFRRRHPNRNLRTSCTLRCPNSCAFRAQVRLRVRSRWWRRQTGHVLSQPLSSRSKYCPRRLLCPIRLPDFECRWRPCWWRWRPPWAARGCHRRRSPHCRCTRRIRCHRRRNYGRWRNSLYGPIYALWLSVSDAARTFQASAHFQCTMSRRHRPMSTCTLAGSRYS